jgi:RimJ/RimL family protein N-acetyltransferase
MPLILLDNHQYPSALALFPNRRHMMKLLALEEGGVQGQVWADDAAHPALSLVRIHNKLLLASQLAEDTIVAMLDDFRLPELVYGAMMEGEEDAALLFWEGLHCRAALQRALPGRFPAFSSQECYDAPSAQIPQVTVPAGYDLVAVDAALLARELENTDDLRQEMCSERPSVEDFLARSFGIAAVRDGALVGWCLSEYNCTEGCEVGIEVVAGHRRQGLASAMVSALAAEAARRGLGRVGWLCDGANAASSATAQRMGLRKVREYGRLLCLKNVAVEMTVNGEYCMRDGQAEQADAWFAQALAQEHPPLWAGVLQAMARVRLGRLDDAFAALEAVLGKGFGNWGWMNHDPALAALRQDARWRQLLAEYGGPQVDE